MITCDNCSSDSELLFPHITSNNELFYVCSKCKNELNILKNDINSLLIKQNETIKKLKNKNIDFKFIKPE